MYMCVCMHTSTHMLIHMCILIMIIILVMIDYNIVHAAEEVSPNLSVLFVADLSACVFACLYSCVMCCYRLLMLCLFCLGHTCHILPASEIDLGLFLPVFAGSGGEYLFPRIG